MSQAAGVEWLRSERSAGGVGLDLTCDNHGFCDLATRLYSDAPYRPGNGRDDRRLLPAADDAVRAVALLEAEI